MMPDPLDSALATPYREGDGVMDKIETVANILSDYEDQLSDGYTFYSDNVDRVLEKLASEIVESISDKWISVDDRLPPENLSVLVCFKGAAWLPEKMFYRSGIWYHMQGNPFINKPTHWMPLPDPPKESEE